MTLIKDQHGSIIDIHQAKSCAIWLNFGGGSMQLSNDNIGSLHIGGMLDFINDFCKVDFHDFYKTTLSGKIKVCGCKHCTKYAKTLKEFGEFDDASKQCLYYEQYGISKSKYSVSHHDGIKKHKDGSKFYDIALFKSKAKKDSFVKTLITAGYILER